MMTILLTMLPLVVAAPYLPGPQSQDPGLAGTWRAVLDLAGGSLPFTLVVDRSGDTLGGRVCSGPSCTALSGITSRNGETVLEMADYAATITVTRRGRGDSLVGMYRNVGNRGPRAIPVRAVRGTWPVSRAPAPLLGRWDATFVTDGRRSPRVFEFRNGPHGLEAAFLANSGDYGLFSGEAVRDSFFVARFDGAFVYLLAGRLAGDTLRGVFHAGLRTQTPYTAVRSTGRPHLVAPLELTRADTVNRFRFSFPDLDGSTVTQDDDRFRGRVVLVDIFGTWCPTCHEAVPLLLELYREYRDRGLQIVGFGYEVAGDSAIDNRQIRLFRDKYRIPWPLLRAGINVVEETAATLPQLQGFTAYPTTVFLGRDGRVKHVYAGFRGPAAPEQHRRQAAEFRQLIESLLAAP